MKINPFSLPMPVASKGETRSFPDPDQPGQVLTLTLRRLGDDEMGVYVDSCESHVEAYLGDPDNDVPPTQRFPAIRGRRVLMSKLLIQNALMVTSMQCPENDDDAYTFEQTVAAALTMRTAWRGVMAWVRELNKQGKAAGLGTLPGGATSGPPSEPDSPTPSTS